MKTANQNFKRKLAGVAALATGAVVASPAMAAGTTLEFDTTEFLANVAALGGWNLVAGAAMIGVTASIMLMRKGRGVVSR